MGLISKKAKTSAGKLFGINRIYGADGDHETPYMTRAWFGRLRLHVFHRGDADPDCHDHPWGFWTFPLRSYVEEVLEERVETKWVPDRPVLSGYDRDGDPIWLDHQTIGGGHQEKRTYFERRLQIAHAFRWHYRPATHTHRVLGVWDKNFDGWAKTGYRYATVPSRVPNDERIVVVPAFKPIGNIPTIVWRDAPSRPWGFVKERLGKWCWTPWMTYVFEGGKEAPCGEQKAGGRPKDV